MSIYRTETKYRKLWRNIKIALLLVFLVIVFAMAGKARLSALHPEGEYGTIDDSQIAVQSDDAEEPSSSKEASTEAGTAAGIDLSRIPEYTGTPTYVLNGNKPEFTDEEYERAETEFISLSELDYLGRCGACMASLSKDMIDSAGERRDISQYTPSGWDQASYPGIIETEGSWLYHRAHLIAHMFAGEDPEIDGPKNLITGTEYMNEKGMLPYCERAVQNWLIRKANGGRVLYRVTPVFVDNELVCRGVHIEAADLPTKGSEFHINVFCYNVQPKIEIDYSSGKSWKE